MVILGVDPGSRVTGYGVISVEGSRYRCIDYGTISASGPAGADSLPHRLQKIYIELQGVLERNSPGGIAVENVFYATNVKSALRLGHARGIVLLVAAQFGIPLFEYSPLEIKKAVVGYGRADKGQIQMMVGRLLNLRQKPQPHDAADALAIALCHAFCNPRPLSEAKARALQKGKKT